VLIEDVSGTVVGKGALTGAIDHDGGTHVRVPNPGLARLHSRPQREHRTAISNGVRLTTFGSGSPQFGHAGIFNLATRRSTVRGFAVLIVSVPSSGQRDPRLAEPPGERACRHGRPT
jgi:hypothetical protein